MTLFTEGRLQAFERMMQDTGKYHRREDSEDRSRKCPKKKTEPAKKDGEHHAGKLMNGRYALCPYRLLGTILQK